MDAELSEDDEGKTVLDRNGERVGTVHDVDYSAVQIAAETDIGEGARRLQERDDDAIYEVQDEQVVDVTDSEVRVDIGE